MKNKPRLSVVVLSISIIYGCASNIKHPVNIKNSSKIEAEQSLKKAALNQHLLKTQVLTHYKEWKGVRHKWGGNSRSGIDCSAYTQRVYQELFNIQLPRSSRQQKRIGKAVKKTEMKVGDLLFFNPKIITGHVGIYLGDNTFVHVSSSKGVMRSPINSGYWRKHFQSVRRVF